MHTNTDNEAESFEWNKNKKIKMLLALLISNSLTKLEN